MEGRNLGTSRRESALGGAGRNGAKFESARRVVRILDLVGRRGSLTAKTLAQELGVSLSTCYRLINILVEEGYLRKVSPRSGYELGPAVAALHAGAAGTIFWTPCSSRSSRSWRSGPGGTPTWGCSPTGP